MQNRSIPPGIISAISVLLFIVSCRLPALTFDLVKGGPGSVTWSGGECLFFTLFGPFMLQLEGMANVLFLIAAILLGIRLPKPALIVSILALIFAAETFSLFRVQVMLDEGGVKMGQLQQLNIGFFLWVGSMLLVLVTAAVHCRSTAASSSNPPMVL